MKIPKLLSECLACSNEDGQALAADLLERFFSVDVIIVDKMYCYAPGTIPLLLVAHTDTVHDSPPSTIYGDSAKRVVWSPDGLGADDRAGVYAIATVLASGLRPHVLFTDGEERGGVGAEDASYFMPAPDVRLMIQLDRRGANDAVYYSCHNPSLERWVTKRGYETAIGSFTDIATLMPAWGIAGVNLSVGYYREHSSAEHLKLDELERTIDRVKAMCRNPPQRPFIYHAHKPVPWYDRLPSHYQSVSQDDIDGRAELDSDDEPSSYADRLARDWRRWNKGEYNDDDIIT